MQARQSIVCMDFGLVSSKPKTLNPLIHQARHPRLDAGIMAIPAQTGYGVKLGWGDLYGDIWGFRADL